jgi:peptide/nickel transport system ATP-binding protein
MTDPTIQTDDLTKHFTLNDSFVSRLFGTETKTVKAVDGVSFKIEQGESFGLAGESGCGKTTLSKTLLDLYSPTSGDVYFNGRNIADMSDKEMDSDFRMEAQIVYQNPYESVNPGYTVRRWVREPLDVHGIGDRDERESRVAETLERVGLKPAEAYIDEYSSELSGGERQRVSIARAIILDPSFLVGDEPVSMLDVSARASILHLLDDLQAELGLSSLYISHDLSMLKYMCDRIGVMYLGKLVEVGPTEQIINDPKHPYTKALVGSTPIIDPDQERETIDLEGEVPDPVNLPSGCRFAPRCPEAMEECTQAEPPMFDVNDEQIARCVLYDD